MGAQLFLAVLLVAAPDISRYGYVPAAVKDATLVGSMSAGLPLYSPTPAVKALPPAARVVAVQALAGFVKSWVMSPEFKAAYASRLKDVRGPPPAPKRSADELAKARRAEMEESIKQMLAASAQMPKEARAAAKATAAELRKSTEAMLKDRSSMEALETERFAEEQGRWEQVLKDMPDDVNVAVRRKLTAFLEETRDIDYAAALKVGPTGQRVFAKEEYEAKSPEWKMGFRAGKEATEAARAFVTAWLKELR